MLKKILVPIDGTEYSWRALEYALGLAKLSGGELVVLTVIKDGENADRDEIAFDEESDEVDVMQVGNEVLYAAKAILGGNEDVPRSFILEEGMKPANVILEVEKREHCDTIVLGSRGYSNLKAIFKNSVSKIVYEEADVPVIIIK